MQFQEDLMLYEVKALMQKIKRSMIQEQIVALITFKYFEDKDAIKYVSFYQYCYFSNCM